MDSASDNARASRIISADYFATLGLKMVHGREFTQTEEQSATAPRSAIVDQVLAAKLFGSDDPVGQMIVIVPQPGIPGARPEGPMQIVGIAPPIRDELLDRTPAAHLYLPTGRYHRSNMHLQVRLTAGRDEASALDDVRRTIRAADASLPVLRISTMKAFHQQGLELWAISAAGRLFTTIGVLALVLAVVGVYGLRSYIVSQRRREIGIRMALGASPRDVLGMMLRDGLGLTAAGLAIGVPLAGLVSLAFAKVFVDLGGFDPFVIGSAAVILGTAATAAGLLPARRATRANPASALRAE
jgi:hypothetical protein